MERFLEDIMKKEFICKSTLPDLRVSGSESGFWIWVKCRWQIHFYKKGAWKSWNQEIVGNFLKSPRDLAVDLGDRGDGQYK